jgi:hypothetical protein
VRAFSIKTGLDASTVTPGSTALDWSLTVPVRVPCADAADGRRTALRIAAGMKTTFDARRMVILLRYRASSRRQRPRPTDWIGVGIQRLLDAFVNEEYGFGEARSSVSC